MKLEILNNEIQLSKKPIFTHLQLLELYKTASDLKDPIILELGVDKGNSTKIFYQAIKNKKNSKLISVDIVDCSSVLSSKKWIFIKEDSSNITNVLKKAPIINQRGIDILYIDSLHDVDHIKKELYGYFPYLNQDAFIFFDDVDHGKYALNENKDSVSFEITNRKIYDFVDAVFRGNITKLDLIIMKGSTGLAKMKKYSLKGSRLSSPKYLKKRSSKLFWKLFYKVIFRNEYKPKY